MTVQRGVLTSQNLAKSSRIFVVADSPPPCFRDPRGEWTCGHDHTPSVPLQDAYQYFEGWTSQGGF